MPRPAKYLSFAAIVGSAFVLSACVMPAANTGYNPAAGYNTPKYAAGPVDVSDLNNGAEGHAKQQLGARGFRQVDARTGGQFDNSWWLNSNTNQCFQLETADGKVMTLNSAEPGNCRAPSGSGNVQESSTSLPQAAQAACFARFGEPKHRGIKQVSPLKPGYWEVIITGKQGRQVACTVDRNGVISDWVDM